MASARFSRLMHGAQRSIPTTQAPLRRRSGLSYSIVLRPFLNRTSPLWNDVIQPRAVPLRHQLQAPAFRIGSQVKRSLVTTWYQQITDSAKSDLPRRIAADIGVRLEN